MPRFRLKEERMKNTEYTVERLRDIKNAHERKSASDETDEKKSANEQLKSRLNEFKECWVSSSKLVNDENLKRNLSEKEKNIESITVNNEKLLDQDIADETYDIADKIKELTRKYRTVFLDEGEQRKEFKEDFDELARRVDDLLERL